MSRMAYSMRLLGELFEVETFVFAAHLHSETEAMHLRIASFDAFLAATCLAAVAYPIVAAIVTVVTET